MRLIGIDDLPMVPEILEVTGGEFCASERIDPSMVAATCQSGYIPMGVEWSETSLLLVKCHHQRCILDPWGVHVATNVKRYSRGLTIRCDSDFPTAIQAVTVAHENNWLVPELVSVLSELYKTQVNGVRTHSVEVFHDDVLVAGEIGYSIGKVYTSLSGFHRRNGAGSVQMVALAVLLRDAGFDFWDLGMEADYKMRLGAQLVGRSTFLERYREAGANRSEGMEARLPREECSCFELVQRARASNRP